MNSEEIIEELGIEGVELGLCQSTRESREMLRSFVKELAGRGAARVDVLEIGAYEGASALVWSCAIEEHLGGKGSVLCVDPWEPYWEDAKHSKDWEQVELALANGEAFRRFAHNITLAPVLISWMRAPFAEAEARLGDSLYDIVYVDGDHSLDAVGIDIALGRRHLKPGGIICGDNFQHEYPGVMHAARKAFGASLKVESCVWRAA